VSFAAITLCVASQRVFIVVVVVVVVVYFVTTQPGNFWIYPRKKVEIILKSLNRFRRTFTFFKFLKNCLWYKKLVYDTKYVFN
jgi:hypothetical protein